MSDDEGEDAGRPPRFITPAGIARIRAEYSQLFGTERPKLVETISWAAGNGDRSENGDYIYSRKQLREIDRRISYLSRVMKHAEVVDPAAQVERDRVHFGATVELVDEDDARRVMTLVGEDEADASAGLINWTAPIARALIGARVGDERTVLLPAGDKSYEGDRHQLSKPLIVIPRKRQIIQPFVGPA